MASSATAPNSLSFFSSSLFLSSSHQIPKTYISVSKFGSGKASKPLSVASQLATLPIISFEGEKVGETYLDLKTAPEDTTRAVVQGRFQSCIWVYGSSHLCDGYHKEEIREKVRFMLSDLCCQIYVPEFVDEGEEDLGNFKEPTTDFHV